MLSVRRQSPCPTRPCSKLGAADNDNDTGLSPDMEWIGGGAFSKLRHLGTSSLDLFSSSPSSSPWPPPSPGSRCPPRAHILERQHR